jgi:hypothetical protein
MFQHGGEDLGLIVGPDSLKVIPSCVRSSRCFILASCFLNDTVGTAMHRCSTDYLDPISDGLGEIYCVCEKPAIVTSLKSQTGYPAD